MNRLNTVTTGGNRIATYSYLKNDRVKSVEHGNGMLTQYKYDGFDLQTLQHTKADGSDANVYKYTYDAGGNWTSRTTGEGVLHNYTYDAFGRVQSNSEFKEIYTYDSRGNRSNLTTSAQFEIKDSNFEYDEWNHLKSAAVAGSKAVSYKYNGDDQLYERTENGITTRYYWDEEQIIAEATVSGTTVIPKAS